MIYYEENANINKIYMWNIGNVKIDGKIVLAPMAGITNNSFRSIAKTMGASLVYSEMISTNGIIYGSKKTIDLLTMTDSERPISIQIFGSTKETFIKSAIYIEKNFAPDIIDINLGCPVPKIAIKSKAGSCLLKDPDKIYDIVSSLVNQLHTPITVKIRSGWDKQSINAVEVAKIIEKAGASAICIHPRTRKQGYTGHSDWNIIKQIKQNVNIPVIGNGDIKTIYDAKKMLDETSCDAIMIGRAALGNPWFIKQCKEYVENNNIISLPSYQDKINMIKTHFLLLLKNNDEYTSCLQIRSHALWYLKGIPNIKDIKQEITKVTSKTELFNILEKIEKTIKKSYNEKGEPK
ncbi:MAG: tRNA dihydrouridine synthase DusB [Bacilli bacterium]